MAIEEGTTVDTSGMGWAGVVDDGPSPSEDEADTGVPWDGAADWAFETGAGPTIDSGCRSGLEPIGVTPDGDEATGAKGTKDKIASWLTLSGT